MKKTLLEITQDILNEMDSDEVNSIDDTIESQQVARVVKGCYEAMIANRDWPHLRKLITLDSSLTTAKPTHFRIPEAMKELEFFKYDKYKGEEGRQQYEEVKYLYPDEFLRFTSARNSKNQNVLTIMLDSGIPVLIVNNQAPTYWTSFDDDFIVCDSFQADIEDTLQSRKTQVLAYMEPAWVHTDDAIPDLPSEAFPALVEESKSTAFFVIKQMQNGKAEAKSVQQQRWLSRKAWRTHGGVRYANYGRKGRK